MYKRQGKDKGLPIGNFTSQYLANLYLAYFDHWVKEELAKIVIDVYKRQDLPVLMGTLSLRVRL